MDKKTEIIDLTKKLIELPTVSEDSKENEKALHFIKNYLDVDPACVQLYTKTAHPSLVIATVPDTRDFDVILHGHVDVVPGEKKEFVPTIKENSLHGRGALDMKGGLAVMIILMKELLAQKSNKKIALFVTTDEEIGGYDGVKYLLETHKYHSHFFITGEGLQKNAIITKAKGMLRIIIESHGVPAHAGRPWLGENAIEKLHTVYQEISSLFPIDTTNSQHWHSTINLQRIQGGSNFTRVPHYAEAELDIRFTDEWENIEKIIERITHICKKYKGVTVRKTNINDGMLLTSHEDSYLQKLATAFKKFHPTITQVFDFTHATSDSRHASYLGIPAVEFGPIGKDSHHHDESVEIESLVTYYNILQDFLLSLS